MTYAPTLRVPVGTSQVIRMRHEVTSLTASNRRGKRFQLEPLGDGGSRFRLTIDHPSAPHPTADLPLRSLPPATPATAASPSS